MQKGTLPEVVEHMETHKTLPMDHVQGSLPKGLAWRPQIARSPIQKFNKLPDFCSKKVHTSSISQPLSFKREHLAKKETETKSAESTEKAMTRPASGNLDINSWLDAFKSETETK